MPAAYSFSVPPPPNANWSVVDPGMAPGSGSDWSLPRGGGGATSFHPHRSPFGAGVEPNPNLYIHNVPKDATEEELKDLFSSFGTVERIRLKVNQKIGPQALYAFVTFSSTAEAQAALQQLNGYEMRSRRLRIEFQRSRGDEERPFYSGGGEYCSSNALPHHYNPHAETHRGRSPSFGSRGRDFGGPRGGGAGDRRKRSHHSHTFDVKGYGRGGDQFSYGYEFSGDPHSFKRSRHYEMGRSAVAEDGGHFPVPHYAPGDGSTSAHPHCYTSSKFSGPPATVTWASPGNARLLPANTNEHHTLQKQAPAGRITIYLCELLRQLGIPPVANRNTSGSGAAAMARYHVVLIALVSLLPSDRPPAAPQQVAGQIQHNPVDVNSGFVDVDQRTAHQTNYGGSNFSVTRAETPPHLIAGTPMNIIQNPGDAQGSSSAVLNASRAIRAAMVPQCLGQAPTSGGNMSQFATGKSVTVNTNYQQQPSLVPNQSSKPVWTGSLARNARKKIPINLYAMNGTVEEFLSGETLLNISHRSSWEEVSKKPLSATCYVQLSEAEDAPGSEGAGVLLTTPKREAYQKCFQDHVDYLTLKERAGVVTLSEGKHLYLIPPGTPLFDQFRTPALPTDIPILLGLFAKTLVPANVDPSAGRMPPPDGFVAAPLGSSYSQASPYPQASSYPQGSYVFSQDEAQPAGASRHTMLPPSGGSSNAAMPASKAVLLSTGLSQPVVSHAMPLGNSNIVQRPQFQQVDVHQMHSGGFQQRQQPSAFPSHNGAPTTLQFTSHGPDGRGTTMQQPQPHSGSGGFPCNNPAAGPGQLQPFSSTTGTSQMGQTASLGATSSVQESIANQNIADTLDASSPNSSTLIHLLSNPHLLATLKASTQQHLQHYSAPQQTNAGCSGQQH